MNRFRFGLYLNSLGNYFHREIRDLLTISLKESHFCAECDENEGFRPDVDWHIIIAPHEFFALGNGVPLASAGWPKNLIFVTTEQMESPWFRLAEKIFQHASVIWDIDFSTSKKLKKLGYVCQHLALGYHPDLRMFQPVDHLPTHSTYYFGKEVQYSPSGLNNALSSRPIDVFFVGAWTPRRSRIFARLSDALSKWNSVILLIDTSRPVRSGMTSELSTELICGLEQRSKIVLNIHRDEAMYFESHRILLHGVGQGALVVSEPWSEDSLFGPDHIVDAKIEEMEEKVEGILSVQKNWESASEMASMASDTFYSKRSFNSIVDNLIENLPIARNV